MSQNKSRLSIYFPLFLALAIVAGMAIGLYMAAPVTVQSGTFSLQKGGFDKINALIDYVREEYVDEIDTETLQDKAIENILLELDPHSQYIPASDVAGVTEPLQGNFEGIGVEFNIQKDTIIVITPIIGGPSEKVGIMAGDRIIKVDGEVVAGIGITNSDVVKKLKGPKKTPVDLTIFRNGKEIDFTVIRGTIPINSVEVAMMATPEIGFIKVTRFSRTTGDEFAKAANSLRDQGMKKLILDLRGNGGGFLDAAIKIADEFLDNQKLLVYTEGKSRPRSSFYASRKGSLEKTELAILIDEGSASASEIVAGAIQDNDRGVIIGRRSFGKGLVQEQVLWPDGSAVRLTIARYYTPSGRSIQKPYDNGMEDYFSETWNRFQTGEFYSADSVRMPDSLKFYTTGGRVVYGGGGVMPDLFVPYDTAYTSTFLNEVFNRGLIYSFAFEYIDNNRGKIARYNSPENFNKSFNVTEQMYSDFVTYVRKNGVSKDFTGANTSAKFIKNRIKALLGRHVWGQAGYYTVSNSFDNAVQEAVNFLEKDGFIKKRLATLEEMNRSKES